MYLMKIQTNFVCKNNFRSEFNENTDQFCTQKNFRFVFNENIDQFCMQKNFRSVFNENKDLIFVVVLFTFFFFKKCF